jgi:xanthine/uracil permease
VPAQPARPACRADLPADFGDVRRSCKRVEPCFCVASSNRSLIVGKYRSFALAIAVLVFAGFFWYSGDPLTGIVAALIAIVVQLIVLSFVTQRKERQKN